jgi:hypothetical protein
MITGIAYKKTLKTSEGAIKNGQSRETGNIEYTKKSLKIPKGGNQYS